MCHEHPKIIWAFESASLFSNVGEYDNGCVNGEITVSKIEKYEKGELTDVYRLSDVAREELGVWDLDKEVA